MHPSAYISCIGVLLVMLVEGLWIVSISIDINVLVHINVRIYTYRYSHIFAYICVICRCAISNVSWRLINDYLWLYMLPRSDRYVFMLVLYMYYIWNTRATYIMCYMPIWSTRFVFIPILYGYTYSILSTICVCTCFYDQLRMFICQYCILVQCKYISYMHIYYIDIYIYIYTYVYYLCYYAAIMYYLIWDVYT